MSSSIASHGSIINGLILTWLLLHLMIMVSPCFQGTSLFSPSPPTPFQAMSAQEGGGGDEDNIQLPANMPTWVTSPTFGQFLAAQMKPAIAGAVEAAMNDVRKGISSMKDELEASVTRTVGINRELRGVHADVEWDKHPAGKGMKEQHGYFTEEAILLEQLADSIRNLDDELLSSESLEPISTRLASLMTMNNRRRYICRLAVSHPSASFVAAKTFVEGNADLDADGVRKFIQHCTQDKKAREASSSTNGRQGRIKKKSNPNGKKGKGGNPTKKKRTQGEESD